MHWCRAVMMSLTLDSQVRGSRRSLSLMTRTDTRFSSGGAPLQARCKSLERCSRCCVNPERRRLSSCPTLRKRLT